MMRTGARKKVKQTLHLDRAVHFVWQAGPAWTITTLALVVIQEVLYVSDTLSHEADRGRRHWGEGKEDGTGGIEETTSSRGQLFLDA